MIKNLIFDVGNVLVDFRWQQVVEGLGITGERLDRVRTATLGSPLWNEFDRSALSDEEILAGFIKNDPDCEGEIRLMWDHIGDMIVRYDYAWEWICAVKKAGYGSYILSNYSRRTYGITREQLSFEKLMDGCLFSWQVRQIKPEPEIYRTLLDRFSLNPGECVFIDDNRDNIDAARSLGIAGVLFQGKEQADEELRRLGVRPAPEALRLC